MGMDARILFRDSTSRYIEGTSELIPRARGSELLDQHAPGWEVAVPALSPPLPLRTSFLDFNLTEPELHRDMTTYSTKYVYEFD